ncbi:FAD-dependent oxidoreductase [Aestuariicella hydrocarbonica]|uniref:FAD-dependent oxidoreductase n=1 Tax=Pseudomaricurvus hydrocarbonicus TaxID=1470433 RepID=A0A9E5JW28_9GAMM|nr:FAD-dependent oxidoreductase [Aestuariicella hydrocarbonica]NHO65950.1 FAD-dependent oxidoreductase [Aestuariicella hydrocarbonica]
MNESFDFVVVGSGAGSLCAALLMRDAGKSVVVLEKADLLGGTTATSGGVMWIPNNRYMKAQGIDDSRDQAIAYMDAVIGDSGDTPGTSHERRVAYVDASQQMLEYLISKGLHFRRIPSWPDYHAAAGESEHGRTVISELFDLNQLGEWKEKLRPGFLPLAGYIEEAMQLPTMKRSLKSFGTLLKMIGRTLGTRLAGKHYATAGQALQAQLLHAAVAAGVEIRTNAGVKQLVEESGKVTGVAIDKDGQNWRIGANLGVLLNAGGFAKNQRMLDQYIPGAKTEWSGASESDTGEMIEEGTRLGAAIAQMDQRVGYPVTMVPGKDAPVYMQSDLAKPHTILVDQSGERYQKEAASYMALSNGILERNQQSAAIPSWMIFDSQYTSTFMLAGTMPNKKKLAAWEEAGFLKQGDNLPALAQACGIKAATLEATVSRFNGFVAAGRDEDFHRGDHAYDNWLGDPLAKGSKTLGKIEQGPFYALPIYPGDVSTFGGLVTDVNARVLRDDGSVLEGLYATGVSSASVMGKKATGAGASIGPSLAWAYLAAKHALSTSEPGSELNSAPDSKIDSNTSTTPLTTNETI